MEGRCQTGKLLQNSLFRKSITACEEEGKNCEEMVGSVRKAIMAEK